MNKIKINTIMGKHIINKYKNIIGGSDKNPSEVLGIITLPTLLENGSILVGVALKIFKHVPGRGLDTFYDLCEKLSGNDGFTITQRIFGKLVNGIHVLFEPNEDKKKNIKKFKTIKSTIKNLSNNILAFTDFKLIKKYTSFSPSRKDLQELAKQNGISANIKSSKIMEKLNELGIKLTINTDIIKVPVFDIKNKLYLQFKKLYRKKYRNDIEELDAVVDIHKNYITFENMDGDLLNIESVKLFIEFLYDFNKIILDDISSKKLASDRSIYFESEYQVSASMMQ